MRLASALAVLLLAAGCGGPPIGEKVPRPDTNAVAAGAAAAAAAATLADPDSAGKKPEGDGVEPPQKAVRVKETVPETVLDRADSDSPDDELPPCEPAEDADEGRDRGAASGKESKTEPRRLELIPAPVSDVPHERSTPVRRKKCREPDAEEDSSEPER